MGRISQYLVVLSRKKKTRRMCSPCPEKSCFNWTAIIYKDLCFQSTNHVLKKLNNPRYNLGILFAAVVEQDPHYAVLHRAVMRGHGATSNESSLDDVLSGIGSGSEQRGGREKHTHTGR